MAKGDAVRGRDARPVRRVLLIADTHGTVDARIAALAGRCDVVVHAGDVGADAVLDACGGARVRAVRGNNDTAAKWRGAAHTLAALPERLTLALPGGELAIEHGHRHAPAVRHARLRAAYPRARAVVYGHSHRQVVDRATLPWVLNPGASGHARTFGGPAALVLFAGPRRWRVRAVRYPPLAPKRSARKARIAAKARRATSG